MVLQFVKFGLWAEIAAIGNFYNPFNIANWIVTMIFLSPAFLFLWLASKFPETPKLKKIEAGRFGRFKGGLQLIGLVGFGAILLIFVGLTWYRELIRPYAWSGGIVSEAKANGWELAIERKSRNILPMALGCTVSSCSRVRTNSRNCGERRIYCCAYALGYQRR